MGKIRYYFALWAAKLSIIALKITKHNGTNFPGVLALRICPDFLKYIGKPQKIIAVTGTNGKTTVSNMLLDMLTMDVKRVMNNKMGSNINSGIASSLFYGASLGGRCRYELALFEVAERSAMRIYPYLQPGDIILFDEFNVPLHEFKAFDEFTKAFYIELKPLGAVNNYLQVAFVVK